MAGYTVVVGNQKGGVGKSTLTIHMAHAWVLEGKRVIICDMDLYQQTTKRFFENRKRFFKDRDVSSSLPMPELYASHASSSMSREKEDVAIFCEQDLPKLLQVYDIVLVDTPANDLLLNKMIYAYADTLVTPINDSLLDLDGLAHYDEMTKRTVLGKFSGTVFESKMLRAQNGNQKTFQWMIVRNRLAHHQSKNNQMVAKILEDIKKRVGCSFVDGLFERVVFRELFSKGLTVFDFFDKSTKQADMRLSLSHVAARQEVRSIISSIQERK